MPFYLSPQEAEVGESLQVPGQPGLIASWRLARAPQKYVVSKKKKGREREGGRKEEREGRRERGRKKGREEGRKRKKIYVKTGKQTTQKWFIIIMESMKGRKGRGN